MSLYLKASAGLSAGRGGNAEDTRWCFAQVKGAAEVNVTEGKNTCTSVPPTTAHELLKSVSMLTVSYTVTSLRIYKMNNPSAKLK